MPTFLEKDRIVLAGLKADRATLREAASRSNSLGSWTLCQASYCRAAYASAVKRLVVLGLAERRQRTEASPSHRAVIAHAPRLNTASRMRGSQSYWRGREGPYHRPEGPRTGG